MQFTADARGTAYLNSVALAIGTEFQNIHDRVRSMRDTFQFGPEGSKRYIDQRERSFFQLKLNSFKTKHYKSQDSTQVLVFKMDNVVCQLIKTKGPTGELYKLASYGESPPLPATDTSNQAVPHSTALHMHQSQLIQHV